MTFSLGPGGFIATAQHVCAGATRVVSALCGTESCHFGGPFVVRFRAAVPGRMPFILSVLVILDLEGVTLTDL
jgi:hypothetical protein